MKKFSLVALLALCASAFAQTPESAAQTVETQVQNIMADLQAHKAEYQANPAAFNAFIDREVLPNLALDKLTLFVLGTDRKEVQASGKFDAFKAEFKNLLVRAYSKGWANYTNAKVKVIGTPVVDKNNMATVRVQADYNGESHNAIIQLWWDEGKWKLFDVSFSNVSLGTSYRNTFHTQLKNGGIDALIDYMKKMN